MPVTSIGYQAFYNKFGPTNIIVPHTVTNIADYAIYACENLAAVTLSTNLITLGNAAFSHCTRLQSVTIPDSVISIGINEFDTCISLASITIGSRVATVGSGAFAYCSNLVNIVFPKTLTSIGDYGFYKSPLLTGVYFKGNPPTLGVSVFTYADSATVYYLPGSTGWGATFGTRPTLLWNPQVQTAAPNFGMRTNRFGFTITGTVNIPIVVEASTNLSTQAWVPLLTSTLTNGLIYFADPNWTNSPSRFYRVRSP